ncbi:MAG: hypothetical protein LBF89_04555 [Bacteroidales bacterium]|jgi:hypothetical protein|nr:hypothetical protein [Bacteroidales bacterium]
MALISCAKEIYTDADAAAAKNEAQKAGLTVLLKDITDPTADMSGFTVGSIPYGNGASAVTLSDGIACLRVTRGDVILQVEKEGYPSTTAVVSVQPKETTPFNKVVVIPVFSQMTESIKGKVYTGISPVTDVLVSIDIDMDEWMDAAFSGFSGELKQFRPQAVSYASRKLMQPVTTDEQGSFRFTIPATPVELTYTLQAHETLVEGQYLTGTSIVKTNGRYLRTVDIMVGQ